MMAGEDFVDVQLTEAGKALAVPAGSDVCISTGRKQFRFTAPDYALAHIEKSYEWRVCLSSYRHEGKLLVELATAPRVLQTKLPVVIAAAEDDAKK
jgi:hypothetical protein